MKRVLGLDLGTTSIGWALVNEAENDTEVSEIVKLGVRVNPLSTDEQTNFEKGRPLSTNADRTAKRGARRNLQRYKLRRENLIDILIKNNVINANTPLTEIGKGTTHHTMKFRAKAAKQKIDLEEFAKVLLAVNKKRGYKSSRKATTEDDGQAIDGMAIARLLFEENLTPGQYVLKSLKEGKRYIPDFYRSDLQQEFNHVWNFQQPFYKDILTKELYNELQGKSKTQTSAICQKLFTIEGIKLPGSATEKKELKYQLRVDGITKKLDLEYLAIVLQEINNNLNQSSDYLGAISDRSKELYFNKETVGEYLYKQIKENPHNSLKNQVFYRQDYLDEFERIWETQAHHHSVLNKNLKKEIRDVIIFYQRKLKSQKGLLSFCQFESWEEEYIEKATGKSKKRTIGKRVIPKSSPLFQEFKIWQNINNIVFLNTEKNESIDLSKADDEIRTAVFEELNLRGELNSKDLLTIISRFLKIDKASEWKSNFEKIEGNRTNEKLYNIYQKIAEYEGYGIGWAKMNAAQIKNELKEIFPVIGINSDILVFDAEKENLDQQPSYQLWHLLYSAEDDTKISEEDKLVYGNTNVAIKKKLHLKYGFKPEYAALVTSVGLQQDYGNLSAKAIRNIFPFLIEGHIYSEACRLAEYNHSKSFSKEELSKRVLKPKLEILKKNSLRNPVVEKILNQMVNLINQVIDTYGKPDEVRIELARELKKSAKERKEMTKGIEDATKRNINIKKLITKEFGIKNPTKNDVIRYRLWQELESRGHKSLFTDRYIPMDKLFSKEIDIEHIIPKALLFDDSFSNKTLAYKTINLQKANRTALDFITQDYNSDLEAFTQRVETLYKDKKIKGAKYRKLLMAQSKLPEGFIERDLRNSQYIAKKAKQMLFEVFPSVVSTSGSITDKLRGDWDLINVMKELNLPKYRALGLTEFEERKNNKNVEVIKDWTKRNDHRHHAMDALTVAFTTHNHIQYLNNLNARRDKNHENHRIINNIENKITEINHKGKRRFTPPLLNFRDSAKEHIESILISFKAKNKVVTKNINKTKKSGADNYNTRVQLTPRGQLHKETIYGKSKRPLAKPTKLNKRFSLEDAKLIVNYNQRNVVLLHLAKFDNDSLKAFDSKTLKKEPLVYNDEPFKEVGCFEEIFTIRKDVNPDNFKNEKAIQKVVDEKVKAILLERLKQYNEKPKEAFSDLNKNPIWLNKSKGICIKRVTITGVSNAESLHLAKNHLGEEVLSEQKVIPVDYVSPGNNHHVAIYKDEKGNLKEQLVSFYDAVSRVTLDLPIIDKNYNRHKGWEFMFTMKQNEMFVFPSDDFDPSQIDLKNPKNATEISTHLFRVQKIATKNYFFRHHLETTVDEIKSLKGIAYKPQLGLNKIGGILKVRVNHIGEIVHIGEY